MIWSAHEMYHIALHNRRKTQSLQSHSKKKNHLELQESLHYVTFRQGNVSHSCEKEGKTKSQESQNCDSYSHEMYHRDFKRQKTHTIPIITQPRFGQTG